jgi:signal peptidase I
VKKGVGSIFSNSKRATLAVALGALAVALIGGFVARPCRVEGGSMRPTLADGDRVLVAPLAYRFRAPRRFDVVVLEAPFGDVLVKRIAALPGETVAVVAGRAIVDGRPLDWPGADASKGARTAAVANASAEDDSPPEPVGPSSVWVLGDARDASLDSRTFGAVPLASLEGQVLLRVWPPSRVGRVR